MRDCYPPCAPSGKSQGNPPWARTVGPSGHRERRSRCWRKTSHRCLRAGDGSGNHIGLDFDPWPGGRLGQVIIYGRDEDMKAVLAQSLGQFLNWIADLLESGNFRLEVDPEERVIER